MAHPNDKRPRQGHCKCCSAAQETRGLSPMYDSLKCKYCTARLIQRIGKLPIPQAEAAERRKAVLSDALARGMNEAEIRALVKGGMALEPPSASK